MLNSTPPGGLHENRLLSALPAGNQNDFLSSFESVQLARGQIIDLRSIAEHAYFPLDSIISVISPMKNARSMELAMIGREGLAGIHALLGAETNWERGIVKVSGKALRIKNTVLRQRFLRDAYFSALLMRYFHALYTQIAQAALCYRLHKVRERLQTWLSMMFNRTTSDELQLKHEEIADTLGYHRPTISGATAELQNEKLIRYSRGHIYLLNREMLGQSACECYGIMESQYAQTSLVAPVSQSSPVMFIEHNLTEMANDCINQLDSSIRRIREICNHNDLAISHQKKLVNKH